MGSVGIDEWMPDLCAAGCYLSVPFCLFEFMMMMIPAI
jgi:hypothetical protein